MPARMPRTVPQDATEFKKRMGCMAGVFQIFDRRHGLLLTARRRGGGRGARGTVPPGPDHDHLGSSGNASVQKSSTSDITLDKTFSKNMTDNSCPSVESSRALSSSSACSLLSSRDSNKPVKEELLDISEEPSVQRPTRNSPSLKLLKIEAGSRNKNTGSGDTMQGSISRDPHDLTVKTSTKDARNEVHKDSPRPLLISKLKDGTYVIGVDRSTSVPAYGRESGRPSRFSCDDRQLLRSVEAQDSKKPSARSRELPRLSLDSRKEHSNPSSRPKNVVYTRTDDNLIDALKPQDLPSHRRASSVVAKLMGLEEISRAYEPARSPRTVHDAQNDRQSQSPRMVSPDPTLSQLKNQSPVLKTKPSSRTLPEAAPWRQQERGATGYNAEEKPPSASFYADIQTRLRDLNMSECNKDLRALRILGALHTEDTPCQSETDGGFVPIHRAEADLITNSEKFQSPIVIMKPARAITKPDASRSFDATPSGPKGFGELQHNEPSFTRKRENIDRNKIHSDNESLHSRGKEPVKGTISPRHSSSLSPRVVLKKSDPERTSGLPVPLVSQSKKSNEAVSPRGRERSKPVQAKNMCSDDEVLPIPESKIRLAQVDLGVIGYPNPMKPKSPFLRQSSATSALNHEKTCTVNSMNKKKIHPLENIKSPVSVLDGSLYHEGSSPSLKRISESFKDGETHTSDECLNLTSLPDTPSSKASSEDKQIKPENMKALIQKLELLQFLSDETLKTNTILPSVTSNKDHQYIYDIIYASGLLHNELNLKTMPRQLWAASYSINPELFLILEQAKPDTGKLHRMLIFDLANELITKKMDINQTSRSVQFLPTKKLSGWQIFKDLCAEIDGVLLSTASMIRCSEEEEDGSMLAEDASSGIEEWKSFDSELLEIVLGIERSIFKDLIDEVISEGATGKVQHRQRKLRRHLSFISI